MAISDRITSIEEHIRESYQELEGIGIDTTGADKNLENIPKLIDGYWETLPKVTGEGTSITLDNTKEGKMKINLKGNTSQATSILPSEYTQVDYIESSGTQYINTGHILSANDVIDITYDYVVPGFVFGSRTNNATNYSGIVNEDTSQYNIRMGNVAVYHSDTIPQGTINVHIENGNIKINNEVVSTTSYGTNYFNGNCYLFTTNNNGIAYVGIFARNRIRYFKIKDVIELVPCYRNSDNEVGMYDLVNNVFYANAGTGTFTYGAVATLPNPDYPQDIHVVSGDNSIDVCGKNLLNIQSIVKGRLDNGILGYVSNTTDLTLNDNSFSFTTNANYRGATSDYIPINSGSYVFNSNTSNTLFFLTIACYDKNKVWIKNETVTALASETKRTFTISDDTKFIRAYFYLSSAGTITITNPMLEKGSQATTYEAYTGASYDIDLGTIELCKIGDYQDSIVKDNGKWYLNKQIGKVVFDGSNDESWRLNSAGTYTKYQWSAALPDKYNVINTPLYCSHFKQITVSQGDAKNVIGIVNGSYPGFAIQMICNISTLTDFITWLGTNKPIVYYPLATPTYTEITDTTLQQQLNALEKARSYNSQTNLTQTNNDISFIITATALESITNS